LTDHRFWSARSNKAACVASFLPMSTYARTWENRNKNCTAESSTPPLVKPSVLKQKRMFTSLQKKVYKSVALFFFSVFSFLVVMCLKVRLDSVPGFAYLRETPINRICLRFPRLMAPHRHKHTYTVHNDLP
jgi:hypothetical protein